jgi:hypothetical protein
LNFGSRSRWRFGFRRDRFRHLDFCPSRRLGFRNSCGGSDPWLRRGMSWRRRLHCCGSVGGPTLCTSTVLRTFDGRTTLDDRWANPLLDDLAWLVLSLDLSFSTIDCFRGDHTHVVLYLGKADGLEQRHELLVIHTQIASYLVDTQLAAHPSSESSSPCDPVAMVVT